MTPTRMASMMLCVLLLVYPFSVGPVCRMHCKPTGGSTPFSKAEEIFYAPLRLASQWEPLSRFLEWYVDLWLPQSERFYQ